MKRWLSAISVCFLIFLLFNHYFVILSNFSMDASPKTKQILEKSIREKAIFSRWVSKNTIKHFDYALRLPFYVDHKLTRRGFRYLLVIKESPQQILLELNYQLFFMDTQGNLTPVPSHLSHAYAKEEILFLVNINTKIDQIEAYRQFVKDFVTFLLCSEDSIGPSVEIIRYEDEHGLSYLDYKGMRYILGKKKNYTALLQWIGLLSNKEIQLIIREKNFNEIDFRFDNKIVLRFQSNNS